MKMIMGRQAKKGKEIEVVRSNKSLLKRRSYTQ